MEGITNEELFRLGAAKTAKEWNDACDAVKEARGGNYPQDWFQKVMVSGLYNTTRANWR